MSDLTSLIKQGRAELRAVKDAPGPKLEGLAQFWSVPDIEEFEAFLAGRPLPTSEGALEMLSIHIELDEKICDSSSFDKIDRSFIRGDTAPDSVLVLAGLEAA